MNSYQSIPTELLNWLDTLSGKRIYHPKQLIYQEQDMADHFYYLKKGEVRIYVTSPNGAQKVLAYYKLHHVFGEAAFFDGMPRMSSAEAVSHCEILPVSREVILRCFRENPHLALSMITSLSKTVRMLSSQIHQISFLSAEKRILEFLWKEYSEKKGPIRYTQEEIASLIGCSRMTVSKNLSLLRSSGCLETSYGSIILSKPDVLYKLLKDMETKSST